MSSKIDFFASRERGARIAITMTKQAIIGCLKMKRGTAIASPIRYTRILPSVKPCFSALRKSSFCSSDSSSNVIPVLYGGSDNRATSPEKCKSCCITFRFFVESPPACSVPHSKFRLFLRNAGGRSGFPFP